MVKIKIIFLNFLLMSCSTCANFNGRSFGDKQPKEEICGSKVCLQDASRLLRSISTNKTVKPCDNFKEFAVGNFIKNRTELERSGFLFDNLMLHRERQKQILRIPISSSEQRVYKIAKNFFQKCVDSEYIQNYAKFEVEEFSVDKGYPLIDGADWWPDLVNLTESIFDPSWKLEFFTGYKMTRCLNPRDPESEIICLKFSHDMDFVHKAMVENPDQTRENFLKRLQEIRPMIRVDQALVNSSIYHLISYLEKKLELNPPGQKAIPMILKIRAINKILMPTSNLSLDWFKIINDGYLEHSKPFTEYEEVMITHWQLFAKIWELLEKTPLRILMDVFHLGFLYDFEHTYVPYPIKPSNVPKVKSFINPERQEQCLQLLESYYSPVLVSLYAKNYIKNEDFKDVEGFAKEAIIDIIAEMRKDTKLEKTIIDDVTRKLKKIVILPGGRKEIFDDSKIEEIYEELELTGDEGILEASISLKKYSEKLDGESKRGWFYRAYKLSQVNSVRYFPASDLLLIPIEYLEYPYYDKNRSRFYNTATLFTEVVRSVNEGLRQYMKSEFRHEYTFNYDSIQLGYKNYIKWEKSNRINEKRLPGFTLNNPQMYWLSFANSYFMKYNMNFRSYQLDALNLQFEHFHIWFKAREEFREAFNCNGMTKEENQEFEQLKMEYNKVLRH